MSSANILSKVRTLKAIQWNTQQKPENMKTRLSSFSSPVVSLNSEKILRSLKCDLDFFGFGLIFSVLKHSLNLPGTKSRQTDWHKQSFSVMSNIWYEEVASIFIENTWFISSQKTHQKLQQEKKSSPLNSLYVSLMRPAALAIFSKHFAWKWLKYISQKTPRKESTDEIGSVCVDNRKVTQD